MQIELSGLLPYEVNLEECHELTPSQRFDNMTLLTMGFCHSSMASKERYEYAVGVINREIANLEKMGVDGVELNASDEAPITLTSSGAILNDPILDPIVSQTKGRKKVERFQKSRRKFWNNQTEM